MVVMRARGKLWNPADSTGRNLRRSRMIEVHESRRDGVDKATYRMERNFERENSSIEDQTITRITAVNDRTNDHRNLEKRLEAWGR